MRFPGSLLVVVSMLALAGCLGSGPDGDAGPGPSSSSAASGPCGASEDRDESFEPPGLAGRAAADDQDEASGNRTLRWDLVVEGACQEASATASVTATLAEPPQDCPDLDLRATVATGLSEQPIALSEGALRTGSVAFTPQRTDLGEGAGSFVVSLAVTMASEGFGPHDDQCLDATLSSFRLAADYRAEA